MHSPARILIACDKFKGPVALARMARVLGKPIITFCGKVDAAARSSGLFDSITEFSATGLPLDQLMSRTAQLLENAARHEAVP